jgi:hypothetical protein
MQLFREKPREIDIEYETMTIIDPKAKYLPLDDCDHDDY